MWWADTPGLGPVWSQESRWCSSINALTLVPATSRGSYAVGGVSIVSCIEQSAGLKNRGFKEALQYLRATSSGTDRVNATMPA